jgi:CBS domain-containing protein
VRAIQAARRPLRTVPAGSPLTDVAALMADEGLRAVVVVDEDGLPVGIVTERDLVVRAVARGQRASAPVDVVMTPGVITAEAASPARTVHRLLREHRIRQVPLVDRGRMIGVLERDDLVDESATEILASLRHCPHCGGEWLRPVETEASTNFLCLRCRSCWSITGGTFAAVESRSCSGCAEHNFCRQPLIDYGVDTSRLPAPERAAPRSW